MGAFAAGSVLDASHADLGATVFSSPPLLRVDRAPFGTVDTNDDIYADMDASGAVSRGDIRYHDVTQGGATYFALSRVASSDTDVAVAVSNAVLVGRISGGSMPVDGDDGVYADIDASLTISVGDFRYLLVNFGTIYPAGSTVAAGNLDLGISFNNAPTIRRVDRGPAGVDLSDDLYADIDLSRTVTTADRRLTGFSTFLADTLVAFNDPDVGLAFAAGGILRIPQAPAGLDSLDDYYADYNGDGAINAVEISKTLAVQVLGDTAPEADEWFSAEFLNPQNTRWYDPSDSDNGLTTGSLSRTLIIDDEEAFVSIAADMTVTEGNSGTVVVTTTVSVPSATGGAIEIPFRTTGGTATPGMFNSCSFVTGPDYRNRSHPGPDTTWDDIYVDSDLSGGVSVGDLRFTPVTIGIASYGTGSVVAAGDLDIGIALSGGVQYIRVDLPVDGTGAAGISTTDDLYIDWDGSGSVTTGDTRRTAASGFNVGTNVQDGEADRNGLLRVDQAPAGLGPEDNIYMDSGAGIGGTVSVGDYRFTAVGVFAAGTTVASGDADIGATTSNAIRMVWRNQGAATRGLEDAIYADLAGSNLVSPGDYRFTAAGAYTADSTVAAGDTDVDIPAIFVDRPFVVTIGAGQTSNTIVFNICSETVYEADETFQVILDLTGFPCGGGACDGTQVITIRNDDLPPVLSVANVAANEDTGSLTFTVTRTGATEIASTVTATIAPVTATSGSDFTLPAPVTLNFPPGTSTQNVAVTLLADALHENDETLTLTLSNPTEATLGTSVGTGTISNDDAAPTLTLADGSALEADQGSVLLPLTLTLSAPSGLATTVTYATTSGTATTSLDFAATTATATFPAGQTSLTLYLPIYPDTLDEGNPGNEAFTVTLSSPVNAGITDGTATATILDDDVALLRPLDRDAIEGDAGTTTFDLYATLTKPYHQDLTITYALADASATQPADYQVPSTPHTLLIPAQTSVVALPITLQGDTLDEGAGEAFTFTLTGNDRGLGYFAGDDAATGTILDDDGEPTVAITLPTLTEDAGGVQQIRFDLVGVSGGAPSFAYTLTDGNAVRSDYADPCTTNDYCAAVSGTVTFTTTPQFVDLTVRDDARDEFDETFTLTLGSPSSLTLGQTTFTLRIRDNDLPVLTYAVLDDTASESPAGTPVTLRVTRATDDATEPLWVRYSLTGNLLDVVDPAPLVIPAGSTQADLTVAAVNDALDEADPELTTFTLLASADYSSSGLLPADLLVADDDALPTASFTESASSGSLARTTIPITVALNTPSGRSVTVPLEAAPGTTAVEGAGNDYTLSSTALSYAGGETRKTTTLTILPTATAGRILVLRYEAAGLAAGFAQAGSPATFTYTITGNNVPVAENDFFLVSKTLPTALNVLQNDRDADGETLTLDAPSLVTSGVPASMGTVAIVNGQLTFTPAATPTGSGTFTYKASDGTALGNAGSVTLLLLEDRDGDGRPDVSDNCPGAVNANQADDDGDGLGNVCDAALQDGPQGDLDGDGKKNFEDNCRNAANASQLDSDGDGLGDACDAVAYPDSDGDGAGDPVDNCLGTPNDNQADLDADGAGDVCDEDRDGDGSLNGVDGFPDDADELADSDRDGLGDNGDNCPGASNAAQSDADGDDVGDVCDGDRDGDGVANAADDFPEDATRTLDSDSDGLDDGSDNCPNAANVNQANGDGDSDGDACDGDPEDGPLGDADGDGVANNEDAFPTRRSESRDADDDGEGDNEDTDDDNDSLLDDEEEEAGTDSENPDTDGDELRDDLEVEGGFDPLDARSPDYGVASVAVETDGRGNVVVRFESSGDERVDEYRVWRASTPTLVGRVPHAEGVTDYSFTDNGYPAGEEHAYYVEAVLSAASPVSFAPALSESSGVVEFTVCEVQVADTDGDGLCNAQEVLLGTNSENADSDGDGLADGVEVDEGSDPLHVELDEADVGPASNGVKAWVWWALGGLGAAAILLVGVIVVGPRLRRP
ncbi:MAG TPA: Calx-beta domain-containing protein [Candidatus Thermoplasmatota archaeon]|nr:Calx-beta domain-containing protein [Candidatus Thermoplasmatota archaeon]